MLRIRTFIGVAVVALAQSRSLSQTSDAALSSLKRDWTAAQAFSVPPHLHIRYHEILYPALDDNEFVKLQALVADKPDHPERRALDAETRRRKNGSERVAYEAWYSGPGEWRFNLTDHGQNIFVDQIVTPTIIWSLIPQTLTVIPPGPNAPPHKNYAVAETTIARTLKEFAWGKLGMGRSGLFTPQDASIVQDQWTGTASSADGTTWRGTGRVTLGDGRFIVEKDELLRVPKDPKEEGKTAAFLGWAISDVFGGWLCNRIEEYSADGRLVKVRSLDLMEALDLDSFQQLTQVPTPNGEDIVRGKMQFTSMLDYRSNAEKMVTFLPDGTVETPLPAAALGHAPSGIMRTVGWIVMGVVVITLFAIRLQHVRSSRTRNATPSH